ncbi:Nn.00g050710.m01.CDS01 [Neocucurbitaria sp. VM-36]
MATEDHSAQFQEPPVASIPTRSASNTLDESAQFQEPVSSHSSLDSSSSNDAATTATPEDSDHKSTAKKIKETVKKPFHSSSREEVKSPEMEAGLELIEEKNL